MYLLQCTSHIWTQNFAIIIQHIRIKYIWVFAMDRFSSIISYKISEELMLEVMWNRNSLDGLIPNSWRVKRYGSHRNFICVHNPSPHHTPSSKVAVVIIVKEKCKGFALPPYLDSTLHDWKLIQKFYIISWLERQDRFMVEILEYFLFIFAVSVPLHISGHAVPGLKQKARRA
jgi:hypothetical protein